MPSLSASPTALKRKRRPSGRNCGNRWPTCPGTSIVTAWGSAPDDAVRIPGPAAGIRRISQCLRRTTFDVDAVKLAGGEEADRAAVGRPKGELRALGLRHRLRFY